MKRAYYSNSISGFVSDTPTEILGMLAQGGNFALEPAQRDAWLAQIKVMREALVPYASAGSVYFEYAVPRLGKRIDVVALVHSVLFVFEFKVGEDGFPRHAIDQVYDYALDLKHFHETSHEAFIAPVLVSTAAKTVPNQVTLDGHGDRVFEPICTSVDSIGEVISAVVRQVNAPPIERARWENGRYCPTPTIIEAATALYAGHNVNEISRSGAGAANLTVTTSLVSEIIREAREQSKKVICFVTGVPGAGKTLVGLDVATRHFDKSSELYSVFLSGNGPLVSVLCEALARDKVSKSKEQDKPISKKHAASKVQAFIQNVHHFRDECLQDTARPPVEHVALFDEAQRAWNLPKTAKFMRQKKGRPNFLQSEPEFLISCLDRHPDWAVVVCLVGGGQEINEGEAGIGEWIDAVQRSYPHWQLMLSSRLTDSEYGAGELVEAVKALPNTRFLDDLHLSVSMRSFRAGHVSQLVKQLLDLELEAARDTLQEVQATFPLVITRSVDAAKQWLRGKARANERYGLVVSSQAQRLRPHAIDIRAKINPVHWFLHGKDDVRSSFFLEDAATEFQVQGLELDWAGVVWDGDLRFDGRRWSHYEFKGKRWNRIKKSERQMYLKNAYRVLLTRARQGMVIVVPEGSNSDATRDAAFYDPTFKYLEGLGIKVL